MTQTPFIWGQNGQQLTPDQVERLRVVSALAARSGADTSPVGHWTAGLARLVDGWGGYKGNMRADAQEASGLEAATQWRQGLGEIMSPDQVARKRAEADFFAAQAAGQGVQPAGDFLGAVVQGLRGFEAGRLGAKADRAETAGMASADAAINGNPILSSTLGGDQAGMAAPSPVVSALAASPASQASAGLPNSLVQSESGGNWNALNSEGYGGRGQFGEARLADAARAGIIPAGMTGASYSKAPEAVQLAVENWHRGDILSDLGQYVGVDPDGPGPIPALTESSLLAVAHLGGTGGARKFVESGGAYNPSDSNGTSLADYAMRHAGGAAGWGGPAASSGPRSAVVKALVEGMGNPWVRQEYGGVIGALLGQELQAADPYRQLQIQKAQLELDQMRQPQAPRPIEVGGVLLDPTTYQPIYDSRQAGAEGFTLSPGQQRFDASGQPVATVPEAAPQQYRTISGAEAAQLGLDPAQAYNVGPDGKIAQISGGGTNVTVNNAGADKFAEAFASGDAATINTVSDAGMSAQRNLARVDRLESLLSQGPSGLEAGVKSLAGEYGIKTEGLDTLQAAQALINSMVPEQRQPGSGTMSDADLALYKQSLPRLINTGEGNALIVHTLRGIARYDAEGAQIVQRLRAGEIDRATAFEMLQTRQNPLAGFGEQASRFQAPASAQGLSGADWQDVNGMPGVQIRVK